MEWININRATLETDAMLEAEPVHVCTWLRLMSYCVGQENGGRIKGAKRWSDRTWMRAAMISKADVEQDCPLWKWEDEDLVLAFYPVETEALVKKKRRGGAKGAAVRWHPKEAHPKGVPLGVPEAHPKGVPLAEPLAEPLGVLMRKEREGKESKGKEREEHTLADDLSVQIPTVEEVRVWASGPPGVDPDYAEKKWHEAGESHGWVKNGQLIDWRKRWLRFWTEDCESWFHKKKNRPEFGVENKNRVPSDPDWWWTEPVDVLSRALAGALLAETAEVPRMREVLTLRKTL